MLLLTEQRSYSIAYSAATGIPFDKEHVVCTVCKGCGLLPHPTSYLNVAPCYMCNGRGLVLTEAIEALERKTLKFNPKECCNASPKTLSA